MQRKKKIKRKSEGAEGLPGAEGGAVRHWSVGFTGGAAVLWFQRQLQAVRLSPTVPRRSSGFLVVLLFSPFPRGF